MNYSAAKCSGPAFVFNRPAPAIDVGGSAPEALGGPVGAD